MPLIPALLLAACAHAQDIDVKALKAEAAKGGSVAAQPVVLPASVVVVSNNPPLPGVTDIDHSMENPTFDEDAETAARKNRAGLTRAHIKPHMEISWTGEKGKAWIKKADIQFSLDQKMAISSLYEEETCPYRATKEHESGHWSDNRAILGEELDGLKADLIKAGLPTKEHPVAQDQTDAVEAKIVAAIKTHQAAFKKRAKAAVVVRDDPDAYRKNDYSKCLPPKTKTNEWKTEEP